MLGVSNYFVNVEYCGEFTIVGEPFFPSNVAFVLPMNSEDTRLIDWAILKLHQRGELPGVDDIIKPCRWTRQGPTTIISELFFTVLLPGMIVLVGLIAVRLMQIGRWKLQQVRGGSEKVEDGDSDIENQETTLRLAR